MNSLRQFLADGGPVLPLIIVLSVLLYGRCFRLLFFVFGAYRRAVARENGADGVHDDRAALEEEFLQQRVPIAAMITAAPLLGLLGTVTGMIRAFSGLSSQSDRHSMENLAQGVSEVLVATEAGLAVAIPALLLLYYAHGVLNKTIHRIHLVETSGREAA